MLTYAASHTQMLPSLSPGTEDSYISITSHATSSELGYLRFANAPALPTTQLV